MKIWFRIIKRKIRSKKRGNVLGEELYANSMCKYLSRLKEVESVWVYSQANPPKEKMDFMIYMNDNLPNWSLAEKNILYLQNGYGEWSDKKLEELYKRKRKNKDISISYIKEIMIDMLSFLMNY